MARRRFDLNPGDLVLGKWLVALYDDTHGNKHRRVAGYLERQQFGIVVATVRPPEELMAASLVMTAAGQIGWTWYEMDSEAVGVYPASR